MRERKRPIIRLQEMRILNRQKFGPREKPSSKWWSDPPKLIPILISLIAITISLFSWLESHRARIINEETNRPILTLGEIKPKMILFSNPSEVLIEFTANLKNTGKTTAEMKSINVLGYFTNSANTCTGKVDGEIGKANTGIKEIISNEEQGFLGRTMLSGECSHVTPLNFKVFVFVTYSNIFTQNEYQQYFMKELNISFSDLKKEAKDFNLNS